MKSKTSQTQSEFYSRADVKACTEIQKRNPYGSKAHRDAFNEIRRLADLIGAGEHIGNYED